MALSLKEFKQAKRILPFLMDPTRVSADREMDLERAVGGARIGVACRWYSIISGLAGRNSCRFFNAMVETSFSHLERTKEVDANLF